MQNDNNIMYTSACIALSEATLELMKNQKMAKQNPQASLDELSGYFKAIIEMYSRRIPSGGHAVQRSIEASESDKRGVNDLAIHHKKDI